MVAELDGVAVVVREANIYERDDTSLLTSQELYKVSHLLMELGRVDFDKGVPPSCRAPSAE